MSGSHPKAPGFAGGYLLNSGGRRKSLPLRGGCRAKRDGWGKISPLFFSSPCHVGRRPSRRPLLVGPPPDPASPGHPPRKGEGYAPSTASNVEFGSALFHQRLRSPLLGNTKERGGVIERTGGRRRTRRELRALRTR